jgi:PAS domain S-box-containing protein
LMDNNAIVLSCDGLGRIKKVFRDGFEAARNLSPGDTLVDIFDPKDQQWIEDFLKEIRDKGSVHNWELPTPRSTQLEGLQFSGCWDGQTYLVIGVQSSSDLIPAVEDIYRANKEIPDALSTYLTTRARLDDLKSRVDGTLENELECIQNELNLLQRDLVNKNIALDKSEERFRALSKLSTDLDFCARVEADGTLVREWVTKAIGEITGYSSEKHDDLSGLKEIIHTDDLPRIQSGLERLLSGEVLTGDFRISHKDGDIHWLRSTVQPEWNESGERVARLYGTIADVTERKLTEQALRDREKMLSKILDILPVGVWILDETGMITYGNPAGQRIWSGALYVGPQEFGEYKGWWVETGEPIAVDEWAAARAIQKGETSIGELIEIEAFDGTHRVILHSALPIRDADQKITGAVVVNEDITERVQTDERVLLQSTALEFAANAIVITDRNGIITWVNPAFTCLTGYTLEEARGKNIDLLKSNQQDQEFYDNLWETILSGQVWQGEIINRRKDGSLYMEEMTITPVRSDAGEITHFIEIKQDITGRKRIEEDLRQAYEAAERAHMAEGERRKEAERRQRVAESLGDVITALNSNQSLEQVLDLIVMQARKLLASDGVAVYRLDDERGEYHIESTTGLPAAYTAEMAPSPGYTAMQQAVATRQPVLVPDVAAFHPEVDDRAAPTSWDAKYRALLAVPILVEDETYGAMLLYFADLHPFSDEERNLASLYAEQVALAIDNARLRAEAMEVAAVRERSRLARDLHDAVTQTIYSATLVAEALPKVWERDPAEGLRNLYKLRQLVRGALAEMRTLLFELRPTALITADLGELIMQLGDALTGRTRIPVEVDVKGDADIPEEVKIAMYRITQEAFNNVEKHASAQQVRILLDYSPQYLRLEINDNGRGFDPTAVKSDRMGLRIMQERAQGIGATLEVESQAGKGTRISVIWSSTDKE